MQLIWIILSSSRPKEGWKEEEDSEDSGEAYLFSEIYFNNRRCALGFAHSVVQVLGRNFISECVPMAPRARNGSSGTDRKNNRGAGGQEPSNHHVCLSEAEQAMGLSFTVLCD